MDFVTMLMEVQSGEAAMLADRKLQELVQAIRDTAGGGTLTLKMSVKPGKLGMGGVVQTVVATVDVAIKKPELQLGDSIFYVTEEGSLSRSDPRQDALFEEREMKRNG